jgi:hypothetical protein
VSKINAPSIICVDFDHPGALNASLSRFIKAMLEPEKPFTMASRH